MSKRFTKRKVVKAETSPSTMSARQKNRAKRALLKRRRDKSHQ